MLSVDTNNFKYPTYLLIWHVELCRLWMLNYKVETSHIFKRWEDKYLPYGIWPICIQVVVTNSLRIIIANLLGYIHAILLLIRRISIWFCWIRWLLRFSNSICMDHESNPNGYTINVSPNLYQTLTDLVKAYYWSNGLQDYSYDLYCKLN